MRLLRAGRLGNKRHFSRADAQAPAKSMAAAPYYAKMAGILVDLPLYGLHFGIDGRHSVAYAIGAWPRPGALKSFKGQFL